jgi:hypothetical protein
MSSRKRKIFRATKEVRRRARLTVGAPPPGRRIENKKSKPPKHKKRASEQAEQE